MNERQLFDQLVRIGVVGYPRSLLTEAAKSAMAMDAAESPALKKATLARKKGKGKLLIDTRQLINAIKHEVITGESE